MNYIALTQRVRVPQALQICAKGQTYDILLHLGEHRRIKEGLVGKGGRDYGEEQRSPSYFIWLYTRGEGTFSLKGKTHAYRKGTLVLSSPNEPHVIVQKHSPSTTVLYLGFDMRKEDGSRLLIPFHELLSLWSGETLLPVEVPIQTPIRLMRQLERLMDEYERTWVSRGLCHYFPAHKTIMDILCLLVEHVFTRDEPAMPHADSPLMRVRTDIEQRFDEKLSLRELASRVFLSSEHLCRAFHVAFGTSPMAYQQALRLREAKALLSTSSIGVGEIAYTVGFQSVFHFSRLFTKRVGCTPSRYRIRTRGNGK